MDKQTINTIKRDQTVRGQFAVKSKRAPITYAKGWRFEMVVGDSTGSIPLKYWGGQDEQRVRDVYNAVKEGGVIEVEARVNEFNDKLELSIGENNYFAVLNEGEYDPASFLPRTKKDIGQMWSQLKAIIDSIKDPTLAKIVNETYNPSFVERFKKAPAAMHIHHAWIGGLLEHTLSIATLCEQTLKTYPSLNRDLLLAGALLHDSAKLDEFSVGTTIKVTPMNILVGHLVTGSSNLLAHRGKPGIDDNTLLKLTHMIVSHHGSKDLGSPKIPAFPEAIVLSTMDQMDCSMVRTIKLMDEADNDAVDTYDPKEERTIYLK